MLTIQELNNLRDASNHAFMAERISNVPSLLILCQWVLESGWGSHSPGNNCFGIKEYKGCSGRQLLYTSEFFTPESVLSWLSAKAGRTAEITDATPRSDGKLKYKCQDWFATFPSLTHCFIKRAGLFQNGFYADFTKEYRTTNNFVQYVQSVAKVYATDPDYSSKILQIASIPELNAAIQQARMI